MLSQVFRNLCFAQYLTSKFSNVINCDVITTLNIDDALIGRARLLTGVEEKTALVRLGLESLVERESARRLAKLGGSEPTLKRIPRRRSN